MSSRSKKNCSHHVYLNKLIDFDFGEPLRGDCIADLGNFVGLEGREQKARELAPTKAHGLLTPADVGDAIRR